MLLYLTGHGGDEFLKLHDQVRGEGLSGGASIDEGLLSCCALQPSGQGVVPCCAL